MKKITTLLFSCLMAMAGLAGPVSRTQALDIAKGYLQKNRVARGVSTPVDLTLAYECKSRVTRGVGSLNALFYVFNNNKKDGFVVVAGDDRITPVLGYVDKGSFSLSAVNDGMKWWLGAVEATMMSIVSHDGVKPVFTPKEDKSLKKSVEPMVKVNWGQAAPYNNLCPMDTYHGENVHSLVGCTAVAMAQVLSRWQYPAQCVGQVSYTTHTHKMEITEDLSTFNFEWDKMLPSYSGNKASVAEKDAVAKLMYACGLAVKMDYCSIASGAFLPSAAFENYFGMDQTCNEAQRFYYTRDEWNALVKKELSEGRPLVYNGYSMQAGHAFVCDGYNEEGLFHINWGWDGGLNGYFALAELNSAVEYAGAPTDAEGSFNLDQNIVYGIQPKTEGTVVDHRLYFFNIEDDNCLVRNNVKVKVTNLTTDGNGYKGLVALGVYDKQDKMIAIAGKPVPLDFQNGGFKDVYPLQGKLPAEVTDGLYTVRPVYQNAEGEYIPMLGRKGSSYVSSLTMKVTGGIAKMQKPDSVDAVLKLVNVKPISEQMYAGAKNALEITLRNEGAMYNGPIVLSRHDGDKNNSVYDNNYIIDNGEEVVIRVKIQAPEGIDKDRLEIWMAKTDKDAFHTNGFEYGFVDAFEYDLKVPTAGVPSIKVHRLSINNRNAYLDEFLDVDVALVNNGGFYGNNFYFYAFPKEGGNSLISASKTIAIDKGDTLTLNLQIPVGQLPEGEYFILPYILNNGSLQEIGSQRYAFKKESSGEFLISNGEGYGIFFSSFSYEVPKGLECGIVTSLDDATMTVDYRYHAGDVVPAHTPVILKSTVGRGSFTYRLVKTDAVAPKENMLTNRTDDKRYTYAGDGEYWYYQFKSKNGHYGFYKRNNEGSAFSLKSDQCYLALPAGQGHPEGYALVEAVTGIKELESVPSVETKIYTLSGVRVSASWNNLPKGIYIVNGKKMLK